jgi:hypothetical protein
MLRTKKLPLQGVVDNFLYWLIRPRASSAGIHLEALQQQQYALHQAPQVGLTVDTLFLQDPTSSLRSHNTNMVSGCFLEVPTRTPPAI